MYKVIVDDDTPIENVIGWSTPVSKTLQLEFEDGSFRLLSGWIDVLIERAERVKE